MTVKSLYHNYLQELQKNYSPGEAEAIANIIFDFFGNISRSDIIKNPSYKPDESLVNKLAESLQSLLQNKPVQYITGEAFFVE